MGTAFRRDILDGSTINYLNSCDLKERFLILVAFIIWSITWQALSLVCPQKLLYLSSHKHYYADTTYFTIAFSFVFQIDKSRQKVIQ